MMKDKSGREYAKLSELKAGDKVELDNDFPCRDAGIVELYKTQEGDLGFDCTGGFHSLAGQLADESDETDDSLIGIYKV